MPPGMPLVAVAGSDPVMVTGTPFLATLNGS